MHFFVDVDNTICITDGLDYENSIPIPSRILKINRLYDAGHTITIYTGRGSASCLRNYLKELTTRQLREWGVKYHYLSLGEKPAYDLLIDDRNVSLEQLDGDFLEYFCSGS